MTVSTQLHDYGSHNISCDPVLRHSQPCEQEMPYERMYLEPAGWVTQREASIKCRLSHRTYSSSEQPAGNIRGCIAAGCKQIQPAPKARIDTFKEVRCEELV